MPEPPITPRLQRFVRDRFADRADDALLMVVAAVDHRGWALDERLHAAAVVFSRGDLDRLADALGVAKVDWRDLLVMGGLAGSDWQSTLDQLLGEDD